VGPGIQDRQRGHEDHHPRWTRLERADLFARERARKAQGVSPRQAATVLEVPRPTLQAWRAYQESREACPAVVAFLHRVPGLAFRHRLVLALPRVSTAVGACGMRLGGVCLRITGLDRFVGASYGVQPQVHGRGEEAIVAYRREERARLAHERPAKASTVAHEETCTGGLCLGGIAPVSHDSFLEQTAQARAHDTWPTLREHALAGLNWRVSHSTSEEAPGLLASGAHHLGAQHSPDLFPGQPALSQAVSAPMAAKQRAAAQAAPKAEETRKRGHERLDTPDTASAQRGPGRAPQAPPGLEPVGQQVAAARHAPQRRSAQRETVTQRLRAMGHAYHVGDLARGGRRNGTRSAEDIPRHLDTIRTVAAQALLSATCLDRLEKAERVGPKMPATIACVSGEVRQQVRQLDVAPPVSYARHAPLMPSWSLERVASTRTVPAGEPRRALAERLRPPLCAPGGTLRALPPAAPDRLKQEAAQLAAVLQRSSATVEGRHGDLSLSNHQLRGLDHPRKRAWLTAVHHFFLTRPDGTTAAERFFGQKPRSMLTAILASVDIPPAPLSPPRRAAG
jgi:hypothetical protein